MCVSLSAKNPNTIQTCKKQLLGLNRYSIDTDPEQKFTTRDYPVTGGETKMSF